MRRRACTPIRSELRTWVGAGSLEGALLWSGVEVGLPRQRPSQGRKMPSGFCAAALSDAARYVAFTLVTTCIQVPSSSLPPA